MDNFDKVHAAGENRSKHIQHFVSSCDVHRQRCDAQVHTTVLRFPLTSDNLMCFGVTISGRFRSRPKYSLQVSI